MRKLMWFTIGFFLAAMIGCWAVPRQWYLMASGIAAVVLAVCLLLMLRFPRVRLIGMVIFGCIVGFLWQLGYESFYLSPVRQADGNMASYTIHATDYSYETDYGCAVEGKIYLQGHSYQIRAYLPKETVLSPGDRVSGDFTLRAVLPGCEKASDYYRSNGTFLIAYPEDEVTVTHCDKPPFSVYPAILHNRITDRLEKLFPEKAAGFTKALLLGDTKDIDYATDSAFKVSGIRHVVAVSGLHVSILFSLVYVFACKRRWLTALLGIPALLFFAAVAGFSPSITRACIMHILMVLALLFKREYDPPTALAFAVLVMLAVNPWTVTHVGFQLSVGCMAGIFLFSEKIREWLLDKKRIGRFQGWRQKLAGGIAASVAISIGANIFTTALSAYYFGTVSLISTLTNLLALWAVSYVFYGIILSLLVSLVSMAVAGFFVKITTLGIGYVLWVNGSMASFPLAAVYTESAYILFWLVFCYGMLGIFLLIKRKYPLVFGCCAMIGLCLALMLSWLEPTRDRVRLTVMDVGQGQCILLQSEGRYYLIDCGGDSDALAADKAVAVLHSQGIFQLDGLILTHYDADHAAGALLLLQRIQTKKLYLPDSRDEDGTSAALMEYHDGQIILVQQPLEIRFGLAKISLIPSETAITDNESGLCILFQREKCDILITGDRSARGERELLRNMDIPDLEVLIVGHHGSKYSTCRELLIKTLPDIAIISVGRDNYFGHPTQEVLTRLTQFGCRIYRTDRDGTVIYRE